MGYPGQPRSLLRTRVARGGFYGKQNPLSLCHAGWKLLVRPKGLEPLLQAPEACVISTSLRAQRSIDSNTLGFDAQDGRRLGLLLIHKNYLSRIMVL